MFSFWYVKFEILTAWPDVKIYSSCDRNKDQILEWLVQSWVERAHEFQEEEISVHYS